MVNLNLIDRYLKRGHFGLRRAAVIKPMHIKRYFFLSVTVTDKLEFTDQAGLSLGRFKSNQRDKVRTVIFAPLILKRVNTVKKEKKSQLLHLCPLVIFC